VVDAVDLALSKVARHGVVDGLGRWQVMPQRLFQHHARLRIDQAGVVQVCRNRGEQAGRGGQVEHLDRVRLAGVAQAQVAFGLGGVEADVVQPLQKALPGVGFQRGGFDVGARGLVDEGDVVVACPLVPTDADDAALRCQPAVQVGHVQGGQQLAPRQIAGAAEDHDVQWGFDFSVHGCVHGVAGIVTKLPKKSR